MAVVAAVMTGGGAGAIATIQLCGDSVEAVLRAVFRRAKGGSLDLTPGRILLGEIVDNGEPIDQVTIGCEADHAVAIHCHGNPLIVERIISLLSRGGVRPVPAEQLLARLLSSRETDNAIAVEAKLALTTVKTIEGASLIANQVKAGLTEVLMRWQMHLDSMPLEQIADQAEQILRDSDTARLIVSGCTIALAGPPNTGKSTLLNALAGREKAIVADVRGTTRDWVSVEVRLPPVLATVIDTAGLDFAPAAAGEIDRAARRKSIEMLDKADLAVLLLDASRPAVQLAPSFANMLVGRRVIPVLNKSDLPSRFDLSMLPEHLRETVSISARQGTGIDDLVSAVHRRCGVTGFRLDTAVAFTSGQQILIERLAAATSRSDAAEVIEALTWGPLAVQSGHRSSPADL